MASARTSGRTFYQCATPVGIVNKQKVTPHLTLTGRSSSIFNKVLYNFALLITFLSVILIAVGKVDLLNDS